MDWQTLATSLLGGGGGAALIGYGILRKLRHDVASDSASADARLIQKETIADLRGEIRELRAERKERDVEHRERLEALRREYTEFKNKQQRENIISQEVSKAVMKDLRTIKSPDIGEDRLETTIYVSGMGPLDP